jgi:hypothetical protein
MKRLTASMALVATLIVTLLPSSADARAYRNWHRHSQPVYYVYGSVQSPWTYIYPVANWGPFFHRVRHYGPVLPYESVLIK